MSLELLIVEDDSDVIRHYEKEISEWNEGNTGSKQILSTIARNSKEAGEALKNAYFDAAIIDIRLDDSDTSKTEGNDVLDIIYEKIRFPTYVLSSNIGELDEKYENNHFISKHARDSILFSDLLQKIVKRFLTGITKILGQRGKLEEALDKVFWHHMPNAIPHWEESILDSNVKEKQLLRFTLSHLQEMLSTGEDGADDKSNSAEIYIYPPVKEVPTAGLIVKNKNDKSYAMVITPSCYLAQNKADYVHLVDLVNLLEREDILRKESNKNRIELLSKYIENKKGDRYHFLPKYGELNPNILDFQRVSNIGIGDFDNLYHPVCSISPFFYKDILSRFSSYFARQGSPTSMLILSVQK